MKLTILGSGTCVPSKLRSSPGFLLNIGSQHILFDGGAGTIRRLLETEYSYKDIDYIFISHTHPDHVGDLIPLLMALTYTPGFKRQKSLSIFGPPDFRDFFQTMAQLYGSWVIMPDYKLEVFELNSDSRSFGDWHIISKPMSHMRLSIGYRVEHHGKVFAYSGDTSYCENVVKIARLADLALLECSFPDEEAVEGHLTPSSAAKIAKDAHCKKLILTHFYPSCDKIDVISQCKKIYDGEIVIAQDLMTLSV